MRRFNYAGSVLAVLCLAVPASMPGPARATDPAKARLVIAQALPRLDGDHLKLRLVEVSYGPGGSSEPHSHPCPVVGYVIEGALRTQVRGQAEVVYRAGESFFEEPNGAHLVSANASQDRPVRFLAYFTCDSDVPLSVAVPEAGSARPR